MDDVVTARANYAALDRAASPARIRLSSTVVRVQHLGDPGTATAVKVVYHRGRRLESVSAKHVILASWHAGIPYLFPELPEPQKEALRFAIKVPLVYTNVLIRQWTALQKLGVRTVTSPHFWHTSVSLDFPVSLGQYHHQTDPSRPVVLHLSKSACQPGLPIREQHRAGRRELYATPFERIERSIREQLGRILGPGGFDPAHDILGITVNRWPHGYAYQYNSLFDEFWLAGGETPCSVARRPFGRVAIANADAGAYSYTDASIDHAQRAVRDLIEPR
jgi:spermidine dehydrogenase